MAALLLFGPQQAVAGGQGTPAAPYLLAGLLVGLLAWRFAVTASRTRP
jgi:hypothetical protein